MKITLLDKNTITTTTDIDFSEFAKLGEFTCFDNIQNNEDIVKHAQDTDILILNKVNFNEKLISELPQRVKLIAITATGFDNVDIPTATARGIKVCNVPGYGTASVAQLTFQLMLNLATNFPKQLEALKAFGWSKQTALAIPMNELAGKTIGIIGLGAIGQEVARLAHAFNMIVIGYSRNEKFIPYVRQVSLDTIASQSDYVSLNCALSKDTAKIINSDFLSKMKKNAFVINTARGGLIDESALADAIKQQKIAGAGLDVLTNEPPLADCPLLNLENVILTPHIGWATLEARQCCMNITLENIKGFIQNKPQNLLN